jgi:hypothetical protein
MADTNPCSTPVPSEDLLAITWTSRAHPESQPLENGTSLIADGIKINVTYVGYAFTQEVQWMNVTCSSPIDYCSHRRLMKPAEEYSAFSGTIEPSQFAWERIEGIREGRTVSLRCSFSGGNNDVMAWWAETDNSTWTYANNVLGNMMVTPSNPERMNFLANRSGTLVVGIYNTEKQGGFYTFNATSSVTFYRTGENNVLIDAVVWGSVTTTDIFVVGRNDMDNLFRLTVYGVGVENFFVPAVTNLEVSANETSALITWDILDRNANESHFAEISLSSDGGQTYQLLAVGIAEKHYLWDSSDFYPLDNYRIRVIVKDSRGLTGSAESGDFSTGGSGPPNPPERWSLSLRGSTTTFSNDKPFTLNWTVDYAIFNTPFTANYQVFVNGSLEDGWSETYDDTFGQEIISYTFEPLARGSYVIELKASVASTAHEDYVVVPIQVIQSTGSTTTPETTPPGNPLLAMSPLSVIVTAAGIGIMILFGIPVYRERFGAT